MEIRVTQIKQKSQIDQEKIERASASQWLV